MPRNTYLSRSNPDTSFAGTTTIFGRCMLLLCGMDAIAWGGVQLTADWSLKEGVPMGFWGLVIASFVLIFWSAAWQKRDDLSVALPAGLFALVEGMIIGPSLTHYTETLGPSEVNFALGLVVMATAACAGIAYTFTIPFRKIEGVGMVALIVLILYLVGSWFVAIPEGVDLTISYMACGLFTLLMIADFARLRWMGEQGDNTWGGAAFMALSLFLDQVNLLLFWLRTRD